MRAMLSRARGAETLGKGVNMHVHAADLLLTSPGEAQGRRALDGEPEVEEAFD